MLEHLRAESLWHVWCVCGVCEVRQAAHQPLVPSSPGVGAGAVGSDGVQAAEPQPGDTVLLCAPQQRTRKWVLILWISRAIALGGWEAAVGHWQWRPWGPFPSSCPIRASPAHPLRADGHLKIYNVGVRC